MNYHGDKKIDPTQLDCELLGQTELAIRYGNIWVSAESKRKRAEEHVKVTKARLTNLANANPDKCLGEGVKPTGPNIEAFYRTHPDHIEAKREWVEAEEEEGYANIAKGEICYTRKKALELLIELHGQ